MVLYDGYHLLSATGGTGGAGHGPQIFEKDPSVLENFICFSIWFPRNFFFFTQSRPGKCETLLLPHCFQHFKWTIGNFGLPRRIRGQMWWGHRGELNQNECGFPSLPESPLSLFWFLMYNFFYFYAFLMHNKTNFYLVGQVLDNWGREKQEKGEKTRKERTFRV